MVKKGRKNEDIWQEESGGAGRCIRDPKTVESSRENGRRGCAKENKSRRGQGKGRTTVTPLYTHISMQHIQQYSACRARHTYAQVQRLRSYVSITSMYGHFIYLPIQVD